MPSAEVCRRCARKVPWVSFFGNASLGVYKLAIGLIGGSAALIADSTHSFGDVVGNTGILIATKVSSWEPNERFPYGTGKAEFLGAVFVYTFLLFAAGGIMYHAGVKMVHPDLEAPHFVTLLGALVSIVYNYIMFRYATCVGRRNNSPAILADAFENKADAVSSVACVGGILGAMFLHPICDPLAALFVGGVILWNCQEQLREAAKGLLDTGLSPDELQTIERIVLQNEDVRGVRFIRTRRTGARYWIDIEVTVANDLDVTRIDELAARIRGTLEQHLLCHHVEIFAFPEVAPEHPHLAGSSAQ